TTLFRSPCARPRTNVVLPVPRSPESNTTSPAWSVVARSRARASVSFSDRVSVPATTNHQPPITTLLGRLGIAEAIERIAEIRDHVGSRHRDLAFFCLREVTGGAVQEHGESAGRLRVEGAGEAPRHAGR